MPIVSLEEIRTESWDKKKGSWTDLKEVYLQLDITEIQAKFIKLCVLKIPNSPKS